MLIKNHVIVNADDLGLNESVNRAILYCFEKQYINSTSLLTNTGYFDETVNMIHENDCITGVGIHINFAEGRPVSNFNQHPFLDERGNWNFQKTNKKITVLDNASKAAFLKEIYAQIDKALSAKISIIHLDSHFHLHTLPCFYKLFIHTAKHYKLKLRLSQTYNEGSYFKFMYRKYINHLIKTNNIQYSDYFETVDRFLKREDTFNQNKIIEIMIHPNFDASEKLTDHVDEKTMQNWMIYLDKMAGGLKFQ
jgi:predicted glycoside hydrolase/deacetylase ChbG (UPF0249 family)